MTYPRLTPVIATGSTKERYFDDRFSGIVDVKDFGAKGDGITDDTEAITDALASFTEGTLFFPKGHYLISDTITISNRGSGWKNVDLGGSDIQWAGEAGGTMLHMATRGVVGNGVIRGGSSMNDPHMAGTVLVMTDYWSCAADLMIERFSTSGIECGDDDHHSSLCCQLNNIMIAADNSVLSGDGGATGIKLIGYDCKLSNISVLKCKHGIEIAKAGNNVTNYHCWAALPDGTPAMTVDCSAIYISSTAGSAQNNISNCYFDFVKYVVYCSQNSNIGINLVNCFYWAYPESSNENPVYNAYLMSSNGCKVNVVNFSDSSGGNVNFYPAAVTYKGEYVINEQYNHNHSTKNSSTSDILNACNKVKSDESICVVSQGETCSGYVLIGAILSAYGSDSSNNGFGIFEVTLANRSYSNQTIRIIFSTSGVLTEGKAEEYRGVGGVTLVIGALKTITINNVSQKILPIYAKFNSQDSQTTLFCSIKKRSGPGSMFLKQGGEKITFTSDSYVRDIASNLDAEFLVRYYDNTPDASISNFNDAVEPGTWQLSWSNDTTNKPTASAGYGVLEVLRTRTQAYFSSYERIVQRLLVLGGGGTGAKLQYTRQRTDNSNWESWVEG